MDNTIVAKNSFCEIRDFKEIITKEQFGQWINASVLTKQLAQWVKMYSSFKPERNGSATTNTSPARSSKQSRTGVH